MAELDILSLRCVKKEDRNGRDEVSLHIDGTKVFGPEKMDNGDITAIPIRNHPFTGTVQVELFEEDKNSPAVQLGAVAIHDTLPAFLEVPGVFDDELPGAFYFMEYLVKP